MKPPAEGTFDLVFRAAAGGLGKELGQFQYPVTMRAVGPDRLIVGDANASPPDQQNSRLVAAHMPPPGTGAPVVMTKWVDCTSAIGMAVETEDGGRGRLWVSDHVTATVTAYDLATASVLLVIDKDRALRAGASAWPTAPAGMEVVDGHLLIVDMAGPALVCIALSGFAELRAERA